MPTTSILILLNQLWRQLSSRRRIQFGMLLFLMIVTSLTEVISLSAVLPFLGILTAPERIFEHPLAQPIIKSLGISSSVDLLLPLTIAFTSTVLLAGSTRLLLMWATMRFSYATGADISFSIFQRTLYQPYSVHVTRNSSEVIAGITTKAGVVTGILLQSLIFFSSTILIFFILGTLLFINPLIAATSMVGFSVIYLFIIKLTRKRSSINSYRIARNSSQVIKALQEGLSGIRDVLISGSQATYCQIYRQADLPLRQAQGSNSFISSSPRTGVEALSMVLIAILAYNMSKDTSSFGNAIPILGTLALGAQRMLPAMQQAYAGWTALRGDHISLKDAIDLLKQPLPDYAHQADPIHIPFKQNITLSQAGFRYSPKLPWVFRNIELTIDKGSRIGLIGTTGSGKSTLVDVIMSLLQLTEGTLRVDGQTVNHANHRSWQAHIAHVPQTIFLADISIAENIAFGVPKENIDLAQVRRAAQKAQIADAIESWPQQYNTFVGERGIRLSGGQRQRIGIARALYKQADVIIFDEATSALDNDTEQAVMNAIDNFDKDLTIFIIAHRLSTLKKCTNIIELRDGKITRKGKFIDINPIDTQK